MSWHRCFCQALNLIAGYVLWATLPITLNAQFSALDFGRLSLPEGMPELPVSGMVQDKRGYLWIGTPSGLYRYNGFASKAFLKNITTKAIPDNRITQIEYIEDKVICLTMEGVFIHDCITEKDTSLYLSGAADAPAYLVNTITDVASDGHGGLILLSRAGFMHVDSVMHKKYEYIHRDSSESLGISGSYGRHIVPMPDGQFLITGNHGITSYDPLSRTTAPLEPGIFPVLDSFLIDRSLHFFELNPFEYLFISRHQSKLVYYHAGKNLSFAQPIEERNLHHFRWNTQLVSITDSRYYLLMPGKGTMQMELNTSVQRITHDEFSQGDILPYTMLIDTDRRIWLGTHHGLYKQRDINNGIRKTSPVFDARIPEKAHVQFAISGPCLVTGTAEGSILKCYDKSSLVLIKEINVAPSNSIYSSDILHFAPYGQDSILICTKGPRIWLSTKSWRFQAIDPWVHNPSTFPWFAFQSQINGTLYTIQNSSTLDYYNHTTKKFEAVPLDKKIEQQLRTPTQLAEDWEGNLWLSHHGFCRYNLATSQIDYCRDSFEGAWLGRNNVGSMVMDSFHQVMWFALQRNGIIRYDPEANTFRQFTTSDGLPDQLISAMILVDRHIWIMTPSGLASVSIDDFTFRRYPYGAGASIHFSRKALTYDPETDQLFFMHGMNIMACRPETLLSKNGIPQLLIEQVHCGAHIWHWLDQAQIDIHGKDRKLFIQLSNISYDDTSPLQYSYRYLNEGDTLWRSIGNDGVTSIENLKPGEHKIMFRMGGAGDDIDLVYKTLQIQVFPLLWETLYFKMLIFLLCLGIMWLLVRRQFQRKKIKLEMERQMTALELKALRSRMNPHFIFNSLNSINRYILKEDKGKASYYLSQFAKLIRQTLDYTTEANVSLADEIGVTRLYIELESLRMSNPIQLDIQLDPPIDPENVRVPPLFIQPYVENAIWHGLAPKKENLCLWIRVIKLPAGYAFEIEDNGVGRATSAQQKHQESHVSKGMDIAKETFERYGQVYNMATRVEIIDLVDDAGFSRGTCIRLILESTE